MAITILKTPPLVALTGNQIEFSMQSDNYLESAGSKAVNLITFTDAGQNGSIMILSWSNKAIPIECSDDPDDSGNQIPSKLLIADLTDWVEAVKTKLQLNYYTDQDFILTSNLGELTLTARENGADYIITWTKTWLNPQPTLGTTGGSDRTLHPFFKIGLLLDILEDAEFINIAEDQKPVDTDGKAIFDISKLFSDYLNSQFEFPEASDTLAIARANNCRKYRIRYFEKYGESITARLLTESDPLFTLYAGISHLQKAIYNRQETSFWKKLEYNLYFLTWQPTTKYIDRYQTEKLYFLLQTEISWLSLKAKTTYQDGSSATTNIITIADPVQYQVYEFILTLEKLQLAGYDDETIVKYEVWLQDGSSNILTEIRTFVQDYNPYENIRYFLFLNSLGGWDTLRVTGLQEDGIELTRKEVFKILGSDFTNHDHQIAHSSVKERKTYTANTGWKPKQDLSWIRDFLLSKQIYQIIAGKLVPVIVTSTSVIQNKDQVDLFSISFEFHRAFQNEFYSRQITGAEFTDDFNDDFANE